MLHELQSKVPDDRDVLLGQNEATPQTVRTLIFELLHFL